ncbi:amidohydrolase family protein [Bradyrhizobium sp.]|uniref:amidohydrolase family protein n=1 Tax=Bradyrhizobium sp. TaxID=376 RepID=UPI003C3719D0
MLYTKVGAWFPFEDADRGEIAVGKLADLVVIDRDYFTVPSDEIGKTKAVLTMVGGHIVYATGPFAGFEEQRYRQAASSADLGLRWALS